MWKEREQGGSCRSIGCALKQFLRNVSDIASAAILMGRKERKKQPPFFPVSSRDFVSNAFDHSSQPILPGFICTNIDRQCIK